MIIISIIYIKMFCATFYKANVINYIQLQWYVRINKSLHLRNYRTQRKKGSGLRWCLVKGRGWAGKPGDVTSLHTAAINLKLKNLWSKSPGKMAGLANVGEIASHGKSRGTSSFWRGTGCLKSCMFRL